MQNHAACAAEDTALDGFPIAGAAALPDEAPCLMRPPGDVSVDSSVGPAHSDREVDAPRQPVVKVKKRPGACAPPTKTKEAPFFSPSAGLLAALATPPPAASAADGPSPPSTKRRFDDVAAVPPPAAAAVAAPPPPRVVSKMKKRTKIQQDCITGVKILEETGEMVPITRRAGQRAPTHAPVVKSKAGDAAAPAVKVTGARVQMNKGLEFNSDLMDMLGRMTI
eukprot:TRINITY_DN5732_c0_g1_i1.p1 TRINITY_DN5732_c0_g1~~TRINITY_DN5732_c0_g1_i1.p1  ORF type:complete len:223 (+),score=84.50 TRINITY_DN5732_c0_g1_i1:81-749(+)